MSAAPQPRVTVVRQGSTNGKGKVVAVGSQWNQFLIRVGKTLSCEARRVFNPEGAEIDDIEVLRDGDLLFVSEGEPFGSLRVDTEGAELLVQAVHKLQNNPDVLRFGVAALGAILERADYESQATLDTSVQAVLECMSWHPRDPAITEQCCQALVRLSQSAHGKQLILALNVHKEVMMALRIHGDVVAVQEHGLNVLRLVASTDDLKKLLVDDGAVEAVADSMAAHELNAAVQQEACSTLWHLATGSPDTRLLIGQKGAIGPVVKAVQNHLASLPVVINACGLLRTLSNGCFENKVEIARHGGVKAAVACLFTHPDNHQLQEHFIGLLWTLAANDVDNKKKIIRARGIDAIVTAMRDFPNDSDVQGQACGALNSLASLDDHALRVMRDQQADLLVKAAVDALTASKEVQNYGKSLLKLFDALSVKENRPDFRVTRKAVPGYAAPATAGV